VCAILSLHTPCSLDQLIYASRIPYSYCTGFRLAH